jgi:hypothetical protein
MHRAVSRVEFEPIHEEFVLDGVEGVVAQIFF